MRSQHFCTEEMIKQIQDPKTRIIITFRTGFIPQYKIREVINIKIRDKDKQDEIYCTATVLKIALFSFKNIPKRYLREVERYERKFGPEYRFFKEVFLLKKEGK